MRSYHPQHIENRSADVICKLAMQASEYFSTAQSALTVRPEIDRTWIALISSKRVSILQCKTIIYLCFAIFIMIIISNSSNSSSSCCCCIYVIIHKKKKEKGTSIFGEGGGCFFVVLILFHLQVFFLADALYQKALSDVENDGHGVSIARLRACLPLAAQLRGTPFAEQAQVYMRVCVLICESVGISKHAFKWIFK